MLPYGFALLVILTMLCKFTLTSSEMSFTEDKARAYANNFAVYAQGLNTAATDGWTWTDKTDESVLESSLKTYRKGFEKMGSWHVVTDESGGHCYVFANPSDMPYNSHGAFETSVMDIMGNSTSVGRVVYDSSNGYHLERFARSASKTTVSIPGSLCGDGTFGNNMPKIQKGAIVYVMSYNKKS